jgi:hypothetical protein
LRQRENREGGRHECRSPSHEDSHAARLPCCRRLCFAAAAIIYSFAGERGNFWQFHSALFREAEALRERNRWPTEVTDYHSLPPPYLQRLAKLVLDEDATPQLFRTAPQLYAIYLGVSEKVEERSVAERYGALQLV